MLVLGRNNGQRILIGDDIVITIVEATNGTARVGIEAPRHITVHREEIVIQDKQAAKDAARTDGKKQMAAIAERYEKQRVESGR